MRGAPGRVVVVPFILAESVISHKVTFDTLCQVPAAPILVA